eukprot:NODE_5448_length_581_cov_256.060837.p1 GENE.NODE_5448_length_581_cov_256.060837~~NODE_5448_length_581_cov_256.060837.p1  ORF type:complete len:132 (-),score=38.82 NODE_5448_length_581_cov_256.060837:123-518(-)
MASRGSGRPKGVAAALAPPSKSAPGSTQHAFVKTALDAEDQGKRKGKKRVLERKDTDSQVAKALRDNFPDADATVLDEKVDVNGMTLRQAVAARKRLNRTDPKSFPMGGHFYKEMRTKYWDDDGVDAHQVL